MKAFLALSLFTLSSASFASYTPIVEIALGNDKTIYVIITNDSGMNLTCKYSVSWFINRLSYRREFGKIDMTIDQVTELAFKNDSRNHLSRINAKAVCD